MVFAPRNPSSRKWSSDIIPSQIFRNCRGLENPRPFNSQTIVIVLLSLPPLSIFSRSSCTNGVANGILDLRRITVRRTTVIRNRARSSRREKLKSVEFRSSASLEGRSIRRCWRIDPGPGRGTPGSKDGIPGGFDRSTRDRTTEWSRFNRDGRRPGTERLNRYTTTDHHHRSHHRPSSSRSSWLPRALSLPPPALFSFPSPSPLLRSPSSFLPVTTIATVTRPSSKRRSS